ncbi:hypothetical protein Tco_0480967 [Tanacetum coccineum]
MWSNGDSAKGKAKIAWKYICRPKECGGLGIRNLESWNEALLAKLLWNIASKKDTLWVKWIHMMKLKEGSIWNVQYTSNDNWHWKCLLEIRDKIADRMQYEIGDGSKVYLWYDEWHSSGLLINQVTNRDLYDARIPKMISIAEMIKEGVSNWPNDWDSNVFEFMKLRIPNITNGVNDKVMWRDDDNKLVPFHIKHVMEVINPSTEKLVIVLVDPFICYIAGSLGGANRTILGQLGSSNSLNVHIRKVIYCEGWIGMGLVKGVCLPCRDALPLWLFLAISSEDGL